MPTVKGRAKFARPNRTRRLCQLIIEEERRVSITIGKRQSTFKVIFVCSSGSQSNTRYPRLAVAMIRSGPAVFGNTHPVASNDGSDACKGTAASRSCWKAATHEAPAEHLQPLTGEKMKSSWLYRTA